MLMLQGLLDSPDETQHKEDCSGLAAASHTLLDTMPAPGAADAVFLIRGLFTYYRKYQQSNEEGYDDDVYVYGFVQIVSMIIIPPRVYTHKVGGGGD